MTANKPDGTSSSGVAVQLAAGQSLDVEITLEKSAPAQPSGFLKRLFKAYADDWSGAVASGPEPPRRGLPSPLNSPPFPSADWSYGGSPEIGVPDTNVPPLMHARTQGCERLGVKPTFLSAADFGQLIAKEDAYLSGIMGAIGLKKQP